jgi:uncharacterized protein YceK
VKHKVVLILAVTLALAGCAPSQERFDAVQTALEGSPKMRSKAVEDCVKRIRWSKKQLEISVALTNSTTATVKTVTCQRVIAAIASKRLDYGDIRDLMAARPTPKLVRVLQGR